MSSTELSDLSSPPSSDEELAAPILKVTNGKLSFGKRTVVSSSSDEQEKRETSPPHEYVLADNPDIAVIVMFRSRFHDAFPKNVPNLGPQDIENGVVAQEPGEQVENLLCALLDLVLNRKKAVERGHHGRALEEALQSQKSQWPIAWNGINPLHGGRSFGTMIAAERLNLLKTLIIWSLSVSEVIVQIVKESYKQTRHEDDLNQPLSVQPWGSDTQKRRYWLVEGQLDTPFRLYRESNPKLVRNTWWAVAGNIDELKAVGDKLRAEKSQAARRLADRITSAIPRFEQTEEKRKRKEYRQSRRAQFTRPEPGFSLYEGRTRGKRMKYTFSDDEELSDTTSARRSMRNSNRSTPSDPLAPTVTASGRQIRSNFGKSYGQSLHQREDGSTRQVSSVARDDSEASRRADGRPRRSVRDQAVRARDEFAEYNSVAETTDEEAAASSGDQWDGDDNDVEGKNDEDDADEMSDDSEDSLLDGKQSLIVILKYRKSTAPTIKHERRPGEALSEQPLGVLNSSPTATRLPHQSGPWFDHDPSPFPQNDQYEHVKPIKCPPVPSSSNTPTNVVDTTMGSFNKTGQAQCQSTAEQTGPDALRSPQNRHFLPSQASPAHKQIHQESPMLTHVNKYTSSPSAPAVPAAPAYSSHPPSHSASDYSTSTTFPSYFEQVEAARHTSVTMSPRLHGTNHHHPNGLAHSHEGAHYNTPSVHVSSPSHKKESSQRDRPPSRHGLPPSTTVLPTPHAAHLPQQHASAHNLIFSGIPPALGKSVNNYHDSWTASGGQPPPRPYQEGAPNHATQISHDYTAVHSPSLPSAQPQPQTMVKTHVPPTVNGWPS